jgi:penicillin-binding protein 1A
VQEALLAVWLEQNYTKDEILELYLNRVFSGTRNTASRRRRSSISASRRATCRSAKRRSRRLAAGALAPQSQGQSDARQGPPAARALGAMAKEGYISDAEAKAATIDPARPCAPR